jgi:hypothetical protein
MIRTLLFFLLPVGALAAMLPLGDPVVGIDITASYSDDATEETTGIFLQPNLAPVTPANFAQLRNLMRPVTLDLVGTTESATLKVTGDPVLELYTESGEPFVTPATIDPADLPMTLLLSATRAGTGGLRFRVETTEGIFSDRILVRVGPFPGLAGKTLAGYPHFQFVVAVNDNDIVRTAIDPVRHSERIGLPYDVYVMYHRPSEKWALDNRLVDVTGGVERGTVTAGGIEDNVIDAWTSGLNGNAGIDVGVAYDVVYDFGLDGTLDPGDLVDGYTFRSPVDRDLDANGFGRDEAGFYVVRDLAAGGPLETTTILYSGGTFLGQRTVYPSDLATRGKVPLVVISHGNGHQYTWYDYLQQHLASYGYIVMSHQNNTVPGIETASTTTLTNTDYIIGNQAVIGGGVLDGHIDSHRIVWIGHSRGGEGVARAYDRIYDGLYTPENYTLEDIVLISSIAPTDFLGAPNSNPHEANYHFLYGAADGDVCGCPDNDIAQAFHVLGRAVGFRQSTYVHGADHNDFNCCGFNDFQGPPGTEIGRPEAQQVAKAAYLAVIKRYVEGNIPAKDFLWRQYEDLKPIGVAPTTIVVSQYKEEGVGAEVFVIDDYLTETAPDTSSSGGAVTTDVLNLVENKLNDANTTFTWLTNDPMNGMTFARLNDIPRGAVFDWDSTTPRFMEFEVIPPERDFSDDAYLALRACQGTRHPETTARLGDLTFTVSLIDGNDTISSIEIGAYGGGIEEPYQRTGYGTGAGWQNEMETVRIRLTDFETNGSGIDLTDIKAVRLDFGADFGDAQGRLGIEDIEIYREF